MATLTNTQGQMIDLTTGEVMGRAEGTPDMVTPRETKTNEPSSFLDKVNQLSWGFNSALFALPDAAQRLVGRGLGLNEDQVFQFARGFNIGEKAPVNPEERYARAVGNGVGGALPFTGILGWAAKSRPMAAVAEPAAGVLKGIANDTIKFIQQSPRLAAAMDVAFGAGYEGLRQTVEETVSDDNPNKKLYTELMPAAAFMGLPLAMSVMPSALAFKGGKAAVNKINGFIPKEADLSSVEKEAIDSLSGPFKLPIVNIVPKMLVKRAEAKLAQVFGPISESPEAQQALKQLEDALQDPRVAEAFLVGGKSTFDVAEQTMFGPLLSEKARLLEQLGPAELTSVKKRIAENQQRLTSLIDSFAPEARKPIEEAFMAAQADRQAFFEGMLSQKKDLTAAEVAAISERLGPQDINNLNNELRGVLMAGMEMDYKMRDSILRKMGLKQGTSPEGLPLPTRKDGKSVFPSQDMESAAKALIAKYRPDRPSLRVSIPEPIQLLERFVQTQQAARDRLENDMLSQLTKQAIDEQFEKMGWKPSGDDAKAYVDSVLATVRKDKPKKGSHATLADLAPAANEKGVVRFPTAIPGRKIEINPQQIRDDAARIANENTGIDINVPEALDYLASAQRFRNDSLGRYNAAMQKGRMRLTDADRLIKTGDSIYGDIEKLILDHVPKIKQEYSGMKMVLDDYRAGYEQNLPLLMAQKTRAGEEFLLPNEALLQKAFQNADNLKQLQTTLGNHPQGEELLTRGTIDWLRSKGVVSQEGLVDPKKIRSVLDKNKNIINALPDSIKAKLKDEVQLADDYVKRLGEIDQRMVLAKNTELDTLLSKAARPDADPRQTMAKALADPALMRNLFTELSKDPEKLASLRRSIYDVATEGAQKGGSLKGFLDTNDKSLKILFGDTQHLADLKILADLQRRVNAFADVTGQIPAFDSMDERLKKMMGFGVQFLTTTAREAMVGRINPSTGALALLLRMTASTENQLYQRIFTKALEDPNFAHSMTHVGTPAEAKKAAAALQNIGVNVRQAMEAPSNAQRSMQQEIPQQIEQGRQLPNPVPRETSAKQMLRSMPSAPPTRGTTFNPRVPTTPPATAGSSQVQLMYPAMFPNDPISGLLQQRQAQIQGRQPVAPGQ